ncbi:MULTISPECIES: ComF family protein [Shewanella]|uniref:ComF family protein n=1 Tax=Shewanella baltica (strain OS195) TaxID=399599 RepID=A9L146_SHEB9|nr:MULTISPECIES: ComF family protein [Shewanella]ABX47945.1 conserved hypothetical protein [Shewanella baltica OS195]MCU8004200.1 ComF family protein [Shewanella sp. SM96]
MTHKLEGNWKEGAALDLHTIHSELQPDGSFVNTYTPLGLALNKLKYRNDLSHFEELVVSLTQYINIKNTNKIISVIVPVPASKERNYQPVYAISKEVSRRLGITYDENYIVKIKDTAELKSIECQQERTKLLDGAFTVDLRYKNKNVLILDDLYRSGSTLKELTKTMYNTGLVSNVYIVTLTKTRVHR